MNGIDPAGIVAETLIDSETLQARIAELGAQITSDYADDPPLLVCVLKGAFMFVADGAADLSFRHEHAALQREVVRRAAAAAGVTVQHADVEALIGGDGASRRTLPGGSEAVASAGWLRFSRPR
jgi:hypoxanthine phosphoribosyltransferase